MAPPEMTARPSEMGHLQNGRAAHDVVEHDGELAAGTVGGGGVLAGDLVELLAALVVELQVDQRLAGLIEAAVGVRDVLAGHLHLALDHDPALDVLALRVLLHLGQDLVIERVLVGQRGHAVDRVRQGLLEDLAVVLGHEVELELGDLGKHLLGLRDLRALQAGDLAGAGPCPRAGC